MNKILIIEDDSKLRKYLEEYLRKYDFKIESILNFERVYEEAINSSANLILLDINLPKFDGFYFLNKLRENSRVPIIIISARSDEKEQIRAIDMGADDYVTKPFNSELLLAKINAVLRRYSNENQDTIKCRDIILNCQNMTVSTDEMSVNLSKNEYKLLKLMLYNYNKVVQRQELLSEIWDNEIFIDDNTLTVNVTRLKKKLISINSEIEIITKRSIGYVLK